MQLLLLVSTIARVRGDIALTVPMCALIFHLKWMLVYFENVKEKE